MEKLTAADIMIPLDKYPHIPYWYTLRRAIVEMEKSEIDIGGKKSLPRVVLIFDEKYQLLGMARRRDILRGLEAEFLDTGSAESKGHAFGVKTDPNLLEIFSEKWIHGLKERAERPVSDIMLPITATVEHDDHILKIIYNMVDKNLSLIPVVKDKRIVGVVRSVDVFHEVAKLLM